MADEARPPVAIRVVRPHSSEQEFLDRELDTLTKTTVVLLGAQPKPQGVILRFEVALATGEPLLRGEGRVVGVKPASGGHEAGLTLRFTRLDARSKALVDRAAAMREARARSHSIPPSQLQASPPSHPPPPAHAPPPLPPPPPLSSAQRLSAPPQEAHPRPPRARRNTPTEAMPAFNPDPLSLSLSGLVPGLSPSGLPELAPETKEGLLARLRERAKGLSPERVAEILKPR